MKLASSFGRYDEEWKEGDWKVKGDVPVIMMLCRKKMVSFDAVRQCRSAQDFSSRAARLDALQNIHYSLITYPASD
jgi:hypothetical protein